MSRFSIAVKVWKGAMSHSDCEMKADVPIVYSERYMNIPLKTKYTEKLRLSLLRISITIWWLSLG